MTKKTGTGEFNTRGLSSLLTEAQDKINQLEGAVEDLHDQREQIASAPVAKKEAIEAAEQAIENMAWSGRKHVETEFTRLARGGTPDLRALVTKTREGYPDLVRPNSDALLALLADPLKRAARAVIESSPAFTDSALPRDERAAKLEELDSKIEDAERNRDNFLAELRAEGININERLEVVGSSVDDESSEAGEDSDTEAGPTEPQRIEPLQHDDTTHV